MAAVSSEAANGQFLLQTDDGAALPVDHWTGPAGAPVLLFAHANGLAAGSYGPWLAALAADLAVFAFDARGHGRSTWPAGALETVFHVDRFADDLALVAASVRSRSGGRALHLAAHSLGAAAALRLAARGGALPWETSLLFEPPIFPGADSPHHAEAAPKQLELIERSAQRRAHWESPEALQRRLSERGMFRRFRTDLLAAHCRASLLPLPEGGFRLACPPAVEAAIFRNHRAADTWRRLSAVAAPIHLVGSDPHPADRGWVSVVLPEIAARLPEARLTTLAGTSHMMIFEAPETCRGLILDAIPRR